MTPIRDVASALAVGVGVLLVALLSIILAVLPWLLVVAGTIWLWRYL